MTRKDFVLIAEALKEAREDCMRNGKRSEHEGAAHAAVCIADALSSSTNPRFDRERFLKACGVQS